MRRFVVCLALAGCTTVEPVEIRSIYLYPDSAAETGEDAAQEAPWHDAAVTPEPAPEAYPELDSAPETGPDATPDVAFDSPYQDTTPDAAHETGPDAPEPVCSLAKLGENCEEGTADNKACCPGLLCSALRCVDPDAGVDGAIPCPCNSCGCTIEGEGPVVYVNGKMPLCPALWVCYGPASSPGCNWRFYAEGNQVGGYCDGKEYTMIMCAPCYEWKPCAS